MSSKTPKSLYEAIKPILKLCKISTLFIYSIEDPFKIKKTEKFLIFLLSCVYIASLFFNASQMMGMEILTNLWGVIQLLPILSEIFMLLQQILVRNDVQKFFEIIERFDQLENVNLNEQKAKIWRFFALIVVKYFVAGMLSTFGLLLRLEMYNEVLLAVSREVFFFFYYCRQIFQSLPVIFYCWSLKTRFELLNKSLR